MMLSLRIKVLSIVFLIGHIVGADASSGTSTNSVTTFSSTRTPINTNFASVQHRNSLLPAAAAFAAPKKGRGGGGKKKKNKNSNVVGAGFGQSSQPKLEDLNFPTRVPPNPAEEPCPCGSTTSGSITTRSSADTSDDRLLYKDCCYPFHNGDRVPQSPIDVLKSRYSAFSWRMIPYILETTHGASRDFKKDKIKWAKDLNRDGMFDSYDFVRLDIIKEEIGEGGEGLGGEGGANSNDDDSNTNPNVQVEGFVDFKVNLRANKNSGEHIEGQEIVVQERSRFLRTSEGGWLYAGGDVKSSVGGEDIKLN